MTELGYLYFKGPPPSAENFENIHPSKNFHPKTQFFFLENKKKLENLG